MAKGRATHSTLFLLRIATAKGAPRVSATVPKKVSRQAVGRNGLRRRMYEAIRPFYESLTPNIHAVVIAQAPAATAKFADLRAGMRAIFVKAGVLK